MRHMSNEMYKSTEIHLLSFGLPVTARISSPLVTGTFTHIRSQFQYHITANKREAYYIPRLRVLVMTKRKFVLSSYSLT